VLWAGLSSGQLALFRVGSSGISMLPGRAAHPASAVLACAPFSSRRGLVSVAQSGHVCWWETTNFDLEWECERLLEDSDRSGAVAQAAINLDDSTLVVSEPQKTALTFGNHFLSFL
jgi:hypothetical protein